MFGDNLQALLLGPVIAVVLGLAVGVGLAMLNRFGAGFMTPDDESGAGMALAFGSLMVGVAVTGGLLFAYWAVAPSQIAPFGVSLVASFLVSTVVAVMPQLRGMRTGAKGR